MGNKVLGAAHRGDEDAFSTTLLTLSGCSVTAGATQASTMLEGTSTIQHAWNFMTDPVSQHKLPASVDPSTVVRGEFGPHDHPILGSPDRAPEWLGFHVSEYGEGYARAHMQVRDDMLNGFNIAHGGMIFAFADTCFAWACNNPDGDGSVVTVTQGADVNFLSSPSTGALLTAVGVRHAATGRSGLCDVIVTDELDRVVLEFRGRFRTVVRS